MTMTPSRLAVVLAIVASGGVMMAQQGSRDATARPPAGTATISGRVIAADGTKAPIRRAQVTLQNGDRTIGRTAVTDDAGEFHFAGLPAGRYLLEARKAAYLTGAYGAARPGGTGTPIALGDGQHVSDRIFTLARGAVVTGAVRLENGGPAVGVTVAVLYPEMRGETEVLNTPAVRTTAVTDDNGVYRIFGLPPGEVVVVATNRERINDGTPTDFIQIRPGEVARASAGTVPDGPTRIAPGSIVTYAPVFHPNATDLSAAMRLTLEAGEERASIDVTLRLVPTAILRGIVIGPDGAPVDNAQIRVVSGAELGTLGGAIGGIASTRSTDGGRYMLGSLIPGQYLLLAVANERVGVAAAPGAHAASPPSALWALQEITIAGRDLDVPLQLQPNMIATGRVVVDSASPNPDLTGVEMRLVRAGNTPIFLGGSAPISPGDRSFRMPMLPGRYRLSISTPPASPWVAVSSVLRGQDTLDVAYDVRQGDVVSDWVVTITDRPSELAGTITDAGGRPAADYFLVVFAADRGFWTRPSRRVVQTRTAADGSYVIRGLPAGDYRIAALTDVESGDSFPPAFLDSLLGASLPVTITARQRTTQNLRIGRGQARSTSIGWIVAARRAGR
jgi:protocatechuate 3,4-dioxygenase beta subunit